MTSIPVNRLLKVAFPSDDPINKYDTAHIYLAYQYSLLEHLYSPLVELDEYGQLRPGLAQSFTIEDNKIIFDIRKDQFTQNKTQITAKDVEASLKRQIILNTNTHGFLGKTICNDSKLSNLNSKCTGINVIDDFTISIEAKVNPQLLLPTLTTIDYGIIPINSIDSANLSIRDYSQTSGPYYFSEQDSKKIILNSNKSHFHFREEMPQEVHLKFNLNENESITLFEQGEVDFITPDDSTDSKKIYDYFKNSNSAQQFITLGLKTYLLIFTEIGLKEISVAKRAKIGTYLKKALNNKLHSDFYEETGQFFHPMSFGSLEKQEIDSLNSNLADLNLNVNLSENYEIISSKKIVRLIENLSSTAIQNLTFKTTTKPPNFFKDETDPKLPVKMFIMQTDAGYHEDLALVAYSINAGFLGLNKKEGEAWIENYLSVSNKENRTKLMKELHFNALNNVNIVPLFRTPYVSVLRNNWKYSFSNIYSNYKIWKISNKY